MNNYNMKYFSISELTRSETALKYGIDNSPNEEVKKNLEKLVKNILDPLREHYGYPIHISSGYRCQELNKKVGGSKTSQHMSGRAADICMNDRAIHRKIFNMIQELKLPFDQLIWENNGAWVHVSYDENRNRRMILYK